MTSVIGIAPASFRSATTRWSRSRSVTIPTGFPPASTTSDPTARAFIAAAASRAVSSPEIVSTSLL